MDSFDRLRVKLDRRTRRALARTPLADTTNVVAKQRFGKTKIHGFSSHPTSRPLERRGISIFDLKLVIQTSKPSPVLRNGRRKLAEELKVDSTNEAVVHVHRSLRQFVLWFKFNKFTHVLDATHLASSDSADHASGALARDLGSSAAKVTVESSSSEPLLQKLLHQKYVRPEFRSNKLGLQPTHTVVSVRQAGKFMYSAEVKQLKSSKISTVLLMTTEVALGLKPGTSIVLNESSVFLQSAGTTHVPTYIIWYIYK